MNNRLSLFNKISLTLGLMFLYLPILLVIVFSFNESKIVTVWSGFSLNWYKHLLNNKYLLVATYNSFFIATISATLSVIIGTIIGLLLSRFYKFPGYRLFYSLINMPIMMPDIILGISFLLTFNLLRINLGFTSVILAHTVLCSCYISIIIQSQLGLINRNLEEAAMDLGCTPFNAFRKIVVPLIIPTLAISWLMCFAISMDDLVIASFNYSSDSVTLPIKIYSQIKLGVTPEINVIGTIILFVVSLCILLSYWIRYCLDENKNKIKIN